MSEPLDHEEAPPPAELVLRPIGVVRSPFTERRDAPRQPRVAAGIEGRIELLPGKHFEDALTDLEGWQFLWVVSWFHHNEGWRPRVLPPRSTRRRGVFATRSPYRPNPIGLSVVELVRVDGLTLHVRELDLLDGTPVLDLKPYVPWADAIPAARAGWLEDEASTTSVRDAGEAGERPRDPVASWEVGFSETAAEQLAYLREAGVEVEAQVRAALSLGPRPHAYRRIRIEADGSRVLAQKEWRFRFVVDELRLVVLEVYSGYRPRELASEANGLELHRTFASRFARLPSLKA
ncbi:MAG: tRNA (N6-threonylcarbamoyladenosine(37)-N6)-methyltransferase TrmO [Deltaproteobacteria bacterium]|nr:tRNA (N6-threonylcarbamoyladenosine(37)-N6)-methyltransferase TrmO [Deltaproteobacteria bacterium]